MSEPPLSALDVATGAAPGAARDAAAPWPRDPGTPLEALRATLREALAEPPCVVSFSGGRDSSLLLAVAASVARDERMPPPVAMTLRFPGLATADETAWQERALAAMAPVEWVVHEVGDGELDLLGDAARAGLARHGLTWPYNAHFHAPVARHARAGTMVVGFDGDGLLDGWRWSRAAAVARRRRLRRGEELATVGLAAAPRALRMAVLLRRDTEALPWLTAAAGAADRRRWARELATEPRTWPARLRWLGARRYLALGRDALERVAAGVGARAAFPLAAPRVLAALARAGGRWGYVDRRAVLEQAFPGVLPPEIAARRDKASFDGAFWGPRARAFAGAWDGAGVDPAVVDADALRAEWARPVPHAGSCHLLHAAWLASAEGREEVDRARQAVEAAGPPQDEAR